MKRQLLIAVAGLALPATSIAAQADPCPAGGSGAMASDARANMARDACHQAVDLFNFVAPQLGLALTGGNATLGQGGTLGGFGHFTIGVRGNVFSGDLPEVNKFPTPRTQQNPSAQTLQSKKQVLGLPVADAAIGIFKGIPLGLTNVGGVDLLVSAQYVPSIGNAGDDVQIKPQSNLKFGFGARVGLLQESLVMPGVAVTYFRRDVPTTDITGTSSQLEINIQDASIKTTAWRVVASKSFIMFGLAAGVGQDKYDQSTTVSGLVESQPLTVGGVTVNTGDQPFGPVTLSQDLTRTNAFLDLSLNLPVFKVVVEGGQVSGGSPAIPQINSFSSGKAGDSRFYGSLGVRFGW
jgi:hypothetical protein